MSLPKNLDVETIVEMDISSNSVAEMNNVEEYEDAYDNLDIPLDVSQDSSHPGHGSPSISSISEPHSTVDNTTNIRNEILVVDIIDSANDRPENVDTEPDTQIKRHFIPVKSYASTFVTSRVWKHFQCYNTKDLGEENSSCSRESKVKFEKWSNNIRICKVCYEKNKSNVSCDPEKWEIKAGEKDSTSNMIGHIHRQHADIYKAHTEEEAKANRIRASKMASANIDIFFIRWFKISFCFRAANVTKASYFTASTSSIIAYINRKCLSRILNLAITWKKS